MKDLPPGLLARMREAIMADPQLPRPNPTIALWQEPAHPTVASIQSDTLPPQTDFAIIGSGITGCSVAKGLLESQNVPGAHITVLEARTLVSGATGRNGGHLVTPVGHTYSEFVERFGEDNAQEMARFSIRNIDKVMEMIRELDPALQEASEIRDLHKIMVAGDADTWAKSRASLAAFRQAVPEYKTYHETITPEAVLRDWNIKDAFGAIAHPAGAVWPYRLITGIFEQLLKKYPSRLAIETNTPVTAIAFTGNSPYPYAVTTPRGVIHARQVVHCTNAFAAHLLPRLRGKVYPFRGTMSVQKAGSSLENVGASRSWSMLRRMELDPTTALLRTGLVYLQQNARTGDLWAGTETSNLFDVLTTDDTYVTEDARRILQDFLPTYFDKGWSPQERPEMKGIWSGIMSYTADGLPLVGRLPECITGRPGGAEWMSGAYNGYGMDKAWLSGEALVKMIVGEGVPSWFPKCFVVSEKRFKEDMLTERIIEKFAAYAPGTAHL
ncbi:hypothetical protein ASPZODRAFT_2111090 [Penicilliopsis zonata CBS 506.65]|uniref:FAD dependent oxidoreductase domain-containing protein n=1 Tax=Penicilliopsis zonata CBS 506.65 TaxID=1073090 RepID=A0A1L9SDB8_9EURO|nr:hypothetical protein ASPZODRAFT_2111090 [Penicilliopsis zonata CBS 506.65]OJJ45169.1 hypothetical protein ASPZODRAFT_2111090 [Penicilliopsis zonata CBS 506.65]